MTKALILVGGYGTRLRPLTLSVPKPVVEFCNKAMLIHQIEALSKIGVTEVILAVSYRPDQMMEYLEQHKKLLGGVTVTYSLEKEPLGTAGPLALAREKLLADGDPFFVLNSDITCDFPLAEMLAFHRKHGHEGTILVTKVEDPTKYGVVVFQDDEVKQVQRFVEKPREFVGDKINAGVYVLSPSILKRIKPVKTSIEREIFPAMAAENQLHAFVLPGFWMDVGQPKDYIAGTQVYLSYLQKSHPDMLLQPSPEYTVIQPVLSDPTAKIGAGCVIGPNVCIGSGCIVGEGARLNNTTLLDGAIVKQHAWVHSSIIGWKSIVGRWVRMENTSVLGLGVVVSDELYLNGAKVLPFKDITTSVPQPEVIM